jgi:hypothetical protein
MFSGFCHRDQHNVQETIDMYFVSRFITKSGLGVLPLCFDLLWLQATLTPLGDSMEQCTYTADISTGLAIAAFIFLLIGQVFTMFVTRCLCCGGTFKSGAARVFAVILFVLSWCDFLSISLFGEVESLLTLCRFSFCGGSKKKSLQFLAIRFAEIEANGKCTHMCEWWHFCYCS